MEFNLILKDIQSNINDNGIILFYFHLFINMYIDIFFILI